MSKWFIPLFLYLKNTITACANLIADVTRTIIHVTIAVPYAYFSTVWAGTENPVWPHLLLVPLSAIAGIAVGVGIVFERPKYSEKIHRLAFWLIVLGIAAESVCTISLFVVDERISGAQKDKIIALDEEISPRKLTAGQIAALESLKGKYHRVNLSTETEWEPWSLAIQVSQALEKAGIRASITERPAGIHWTANFLYDEYAFSNPFGAPTRGGELGKVLKESGLLENGWVIDRLPDDLVGKLSKDDPVIIVGEKPPPNNPFLDVPPHADMQPE